ncbi:YIP1 family protein [Dethiosulfatarculus sandiegensis]|nr:YIP1 family protein [Dethiosulfatarculus sandiegensis]
MKRICPFCGANVIDLQKDESTIQETVICPICNGALGMFDIEPSLNSNSDIICNKNSKPTQCQKTKIKSKHFTKEAENPVWVPNNRGIISFFKTTFRFLFMPSKTFSAPADKGKLQATFFALTWQIVAIFSIYFSEIYHINNTYLVFQIILSSAALYLSAAFNHFLLFIVRGTKNGFWETYRVECYSHAGGIFCIIPKTGIIIAGIWYFFILVNGLAIVHGTERWRVILGYSVLILIPVAIAGFVCDLILSDPDQLHSILKNIQKQIQAQEI